MRLIHGDCLEILPTLEEIDLVLADPPYGTTMCTWDSIIPLKPLWEQLKRIAKGAIVLNCTQPFTTTLITSNMEMFKYCWIWDKITTPSGFLNCKKRPLRIVEDVAVFYLKQPAYNPQMVDGLLHVVSVSIVKSDSYGEHQHYKEHRSNQRYPKDLLHFKRDSKRGANHPTQKPVALMEYMIKTYTNEGDTVLDFCMGSGTTGVACKNLNRQFIGIERNRSYFNLAEKRINDA